MKFRKLKRGLPLFIAGSLLSFFLLACNNSNKSEKNSSTSESKTEPAVTNQDTSRTVKRVGRIGVGQSLTKSTDKMASDKSGIYNYAEVAPVYPGGQDALEGYIKDNIVYPEEALENNIEGTVNVRFTIDASGQVADVRTEGNALGYGLEEAAVKAVNQMPHWTPGKVGKKSVKAWYTLPVTFRLEG
ncbi:MAG TPA: energy transducer TonB [Chitinophagaceae bacterium]|nr:energy transducer TonB [Chitinophagaceae bacterium]